MAPAELSTDDKKDAAKVAKYNDDKKAFDEYTAQAKAEPLAAKIADAAGHNRISINFRGYSFLRPRCKPTRDSAADRVAPDVVRVARP